MSEQSKNDFGKNIPKDKLQYMDKIVKESRAKRISKPSEIIEAAEQRRVKNIMKRIKNGDADAVKELNTKRSR